MSTACAFLLPWILCGAPGEAEPRAVDAAVVEVTVFGGSASVKRRAALPPGDGRYALRGLPAELDPDSVRVRLSGGEVVGVEVRERFQPSVPDERVQDLRGRIEALERELAAIEDGAAVAATLEDHVQRLLRQEEHLHQDELAGGRANPEAWEASYRYLADKLVELKSVRRELAPRRQSSQQALADLRLELGRCESSGGVPRKDLLIDCVGSGGTLEVEYAVASAGWEPYYDLRARKDVGSVELAYRAKVFQNTGEDWREAEILLSTAQPQRGAQGPEAQPVWLALVDPKSPASVASQQRGLGYTDGPEETASDDYFLGRGAAPEPAPKPFAAVESEGLSVRFRLPRKETIESRPEPTSVLVGRAELALAAEHYTVPALDPTVWLRGKASNTSAWTLLPGRAAVYFGADFVGHAWLEAVQPGQELTLHLGADPGLTVERTQLADLREAPGVFGSRATQRAAWKIALENHGAFTGRADGSVEVIVQEVLPRPNDDRIEIAIDAVEPSPAEDERWKEERRETNVLTWVVTAPKGGQTTIELATEISFPEDLLVIRQ